MIAKLIKLWKGRCKCRPQTDMYGTHTSLLSTLCCPKHGSEMKKAIERNCK